MRRIKNIISMSVAEAKRVLDDRPTVAEEFTTGESTTRQLLRQLVEKKLPRAKRKKAAFKRLQTGDRWRYRLLRVDPIVAARDHVESIILRHWAMMEEATATIAELVEELTIALPNQENVPAWVRHTVKQAMIRNDAQVLRSPVAPEDPKEPKSGVTSDSTPQINSGEAEVTQQGI